MKNFVHASTPLSLIAPYAVLSGGGFLIGLIFAVALSDAANAAPVIGDVEGVFELTAKAADAPAAGAAAYWDDAAKQITVTAGGNTKVGVFVAAKAANATTAIVRLNGSF